MSDNTKSVEQAFEDKDHTYIKWFEFSDKTKHQLVISENKVYLDGADIEQLIAGDANGYNRGKAEALEKVREWVKNQKLELHMRWEGGLVNREKTTFVNDKINILKVDDLLAELERIKGE